MEILTLRYDAVKKALSRLLESLKKMQKQENKNLYEELRDSSIQRFEFSTDTFWKLMKEYLDKQFMVKVEVPSPRKVFRVCVNNNLISNDEFELLSKIIEDRNITSHTYNEELAEKIVKNIPAYHRLMVSIVDRLIL